MGPEMFQARDSKDDDTSLSVLLPILLQSIWAFPESWAWSHSCSIPSNPDQLEITQHKSVLGHGLLACPYGKAHNGGELQ